MPTPNARHLDTTLSPAERARELLAVMTVEEKAQQLTALVPQVIITDGELGPLAAYVLQDGIGQISGGASLGVSCAADVVRNVNLIQRHLVNETRLGIPAVFHNEALNGLTSPGHMVFPTGIALAASWSPDLVTEMTDLTRQQMVRLGVRQALSPVMDVSLDPRWGRVHETYGEDPYLVAAMSVAFTRGLQSDDLSNGVVATAKHFLGYALSAGGLNLSAVAIGKRELRDVFAYPFEAAIQLAGLRSVMNSYADVDGVPAGTSHEVLTELLRDTLGFEGYVVADYTTFQQVVERQRAASGPEEVARLGLHAGLDVELPIVYAYGTPLAAEVNAGNIDESELDRSVLRVLTSKFELGIFENPYAQETIDVAATLNEGKELSNELARRGVTLLKNDGLLPLKPGALTVAVVGPHAEAAARLFPAYTFPAAREMGRALADGAESNMIGAEAFAPQLEPGAPSMEEFVRSEFGAVPLAEGIRAFAQNVLVEAGTGIVKAVDDDAIARAVDVAASADVVVLAIGGQSSWFTGERTEGEASDTADISLPAVQTELAEAIAALGKPTAVVLVQGRAMALPEAVTNANAIVYTSFAGPFGGDAVARVLFGEDNPSGKLPYSIPRHSGQIPVYHHQKAGSGQRRDTTAVNYLDMPAAPLFPFGHGLSYTSFALSDAESTASITTDGQVRITTTLTNTGELAGATVVQLYLRINTTGGVSRPAQQLAGFARVELAPGEAKELTFAVNASQLGYTNINYDFAVEPAKVDFFLGFSSAELPVHGSFDVTGEARILTSSERSFLSEVTVAAAAS